jgi:hypothetical protein
VGRNREVELVEIVLGYEVERDNFMLPGMNGDEDARGTCALLVVLFCGWRIEVWPNFDSGTLERLLSVLARIKALK